MAESPQHPLQIMEHQTRFDLNVALENWRAELAAQVHLTPDDRRELETHLRDSFAGLKAQGLNEEEAFWLARRRVGQPQQLGEEFVKENPAKVWRERMFWMWLAIFLSNTLASAVNSLAYAIVPINNYSGSFKTMNMVIQIVSITGPILIALLLAIFLAKGKLISQFSKLMLLAENKQRLTVSILICLILSIVARTVGLSIFLSKMHASASAWQNVIPNFHSLIVGLILIWLLPTKNQRTPNCA